MAKIVNIIKLNDETLHKSSWDALSYISSKIDENFTLTFNKMSKMESFAMTAYVIDNIELFKEAISLCDEYHEIEKLRESNEI